MTGVEYFRKKRRLSQLALGELSGVSTPTIGSYERQGIPDHISVTSLLKLSKVLGVTIDELLCEYGENDLTPCDRPCPGSKIYTPHNAVDNYRRRKNLRYQELAELLGLGSRESARVACKRESAHRKHVLALCRFEQLSPEAFLDQYLPNENGGGIQWK